MIRGTTSRMRRRLIAGQKAGGRDCAGTNDRLCPSSVSGMHIVFLLGSGISRDAGMPSVDDITAQVVSGEGVWRHTSGRFVLDAGNPNYELRRARVQRSICVVQWVARQYRDAGAPEAP